MGEPTVWAIAKAEIGRRGWNQGSYADTRDEDHRCWPVCLEGALNVVLGGDPYALSEEVVPYLEHLERHLGLQDEISPKVAAWNDDENRTVEDVYRVLDELDAAERGAD